MAAGRGRGLAGLVLRRLLWLVPTVGAALVVTFALMRAAPGSPWNATIDASAPGGPNAQQLSPAVVEALNRHYGLDRPWPVQLARYARNALRLDFGESYKYPGLPVRELLLRNWTHTATVGLVAFAVIVPVGLGLGLLASAAKDSALDYGVTVLTTLGGAVPNFVVGIFLILTLSVGLYRASGGAYFLPSTGFGLDAHLVLPVVTLALLPVSFLARLTRGAALEVSEQDHVRTARAKGLGRGAVLRGHVLRNALLPILTALGPLAGVLITGSVVVESLFRIPGLGSTYVAAISSRDYPVILGGTVLYSLVFFLVNLVVDVLYVVADPRAEAA